MNAMFDPIRPYLTLIKVALAGAIVSVAFVSGCNHGENNKEGEVATANADRDAHKLQADLNAAALQAVNETTAANVRMAEEWREKADSSAEEAARLKKENLKNQTAWAKQLAKLKKDPGCKALMESKICGIESF